MLKPHWQPRYWLEGTRFKGQVHTEFAQYSDHHWRRFLFEYCRYYHHWYTYDLLEEPFAYLELHFEGEAHVVSEELPRMKRLVEEGMGEYHISLNELSAAISPLFDEQPLAYECFIRSINHVLEAYACNEPVTMFLKREDEYLCTLLGFMRAAIAKAVRMKEYG